MKPFSNMNSAFSGQNSQGIWRLRVYDNESNNTGILYAWGIQINDQQYRDMNLNIRCFIQGFYDSTLNVMVADTMTVNLRSQYSPYSLFSTASDVVNSSGLVTFSIAHNDSLPDGKFFYLQMHHRNLIESWSNGFAYFTNSETSPTFTTTALSTFGNNAIKVDNSPSRFAFYNGDVNQDGSVDLSDIVLVFNDANTFASGYIVTDVTGDDFADLSDLTLVFNNSANFVAVISP
jgi:hypothetical protein